MSPKERFDKALSIFLQQNPSAHRQIESLSPDTAEHLGMEFNDYKKDCSIKLFGQYAKSVGLDVQLLVIKLTAESPDMQKSLEKEYYTGIAAALGMSWDEYLEHNPHLAALS